MNNEEKILAMLEQMSQDISELKAGQAKLEAKVDIIHDQTANLTEQNVIVADKIDALLKVTKVNTYDIAKLRAAQ